MKRILPLVILCLTAALDVGAQVAAPTKVVVFAGDKSLILHWDPDTSPNVAGYNVYRSLTSGGTFTKLNPSLLPSLGYCDLSVSDNLTYYYQVTAVNATSQASPPSALVSATPMSFADDGAFLDYLQEANFDYFWYAANPANGLVPDHSSAGSDCSIAAVGFGLTAIGIAIDHGWISRDAGAARVLTTLNTFWQGPQGTNTSGDIGYNGWFYHFLDMSTATRSGSSELSSIDTTLLLAGILYDQQFFDGTNAVESNIRTLADHIFNRVNWRWMAPDVPGTNGVRMGWQPTTGFSTFGDWIGYDEGMLIYLLGLGATTNALPAACWDYWTSGYVWASFYGESFIEFPPLFGHEYSHCWVDFRHVGDAYMNSERATYFVNSHRAALAQQSYCAANPGGWAGYSSTVWGLTASDDPSGYAAHGAPPAENDNGTIAFTAAGGALAFAPEIALPTLEYFYSHGRPRFWTQYGFVDAYNLSAGWYDTEELGIDQGPIVIMAENHKNQNVWQRFMQNPQIQLGLQRAGFVSLPFMTNLTAQIQPAQGIVTVTWPATSGRTYQVEYSTNLVNWMASPSGEVIAAGSTASWTDAGPPATQTMPLTATERFYRVFQLGWP
jgi:hypothetical protein